VPPKKKPATAARLPRLKAAPPEPAPEAVSESWLACVRAAESRKAADIRVLDLRPLTSFADYFVLCNGTNQRQIQAICDEVLRVMKLRGERPISLEGYDNAEWILADFGDLLVHIFSEKSRTYYDLDRLWRDAEQVAIPPE
jgi:ribosome-associated protein